MKPLYIFDLDGTLANLEHRLHFIQPPPGEKKNWDKFHEACREDTQHLRTILTLGCLQKAGADIWVFSGRSASVRRQTEIWLWANTPLPISSFVNVRMRPIGDYRDDAILKEEWLQTMSKEDRSRLIAVFEDRQRVVDMWRRNGVVCYQVASGNF